MQIHHAKFYSLNPNYLLLSGDKAIIVRVTLNEQQEQVKVADKEPQVPDS